MSISVGYAQRVITPSLAQPVFLAGFGRNRQAHAVHDELYARALALADGAAQLVLVAVDLLGLARPFCRRVEQLLQSRQPGVHLLIAATHTHYGPDTLGIWGLDEMTSGVDAAYMAELEGTIVEVALEALKVRQPLRLRQASVTVGGVAKNARDPDVKDEELTCLQFCRLQDDRPLATLLVYPCHPEVLWDDNRQITSDYCAALRTTVESATGAPALALVGALGGMMTPDTDNHSFAAAAQMGSILGEAALAALAQAPLQPARSLQYARIAFPIPMANPLFHMGIAAGLLPGKLNDDGTMTTEASLLRLGDAWLLAVPGELLPRLGLAYKAQMARAGARVAAVVGLANDEIGYILPADAFAYPADPLAPGAHYEETMSVGIDAGPRLTDAVTALIQGL